MENSISYIAGGEMQTISTCLCFGDEHEDIVARRVYLAICRDRDDKLIKKIIRQELTEEEKMSMSEDDIFEWHRIRNIEFFDHTANKKMSMNHMSDFIDKYTIEDI